MATTTNYSWTTPDDTDLVKDGAAAIRTLGSAIDTSFAADQGDLLLGGVSDIFEPLAIGAAATVLTSDGTTASWVAPAGAAVSGVSLYKATQSMPNGSSTNFTGFTEDYDSASFYTSGTDITIPTAGKYLIIYSVNFAPNSTGYRTLGINKNASTLLENDFGNATAQSFNRPVGLINRAFTFAASDVLKFYVYQNSGVSLDARAFINITYLGA
jgi:hypothetical protein